MKRNYIGLSSTFHDSALAIVNDKGEVVFAEATERYLQYKKTVNIQPDVIFWIRKVIEKYCDPDAELVVAHSWSEAERDYVEAELAEVQARQARVREAYGEVPFFLSRDMENQRHQLEMLRDAMKLTGRNLAYELSQMESWYDRPLHTRRYDHHLCHAATACFTSPFDEGVCAIVDGEGEMGRAHDIFLYRNGRIERLAELQRERTGSLGIFFWMVCQACGFGILTGEEWKVMGLAPYGRMNQDYYKLLRSMLKVNGLEIESAPTAAYTQILWDLYSIQRKKGEPPLVSADLAYTGQEVFTEVFFELLRNLYARGYSKNLIAGGGCLLNSTASGKICGQTGFEKLHVYAAPADDGNALGAALLAFQEDHPEWRPAAKTGSPYLGSTVGGESLDNLLAHGRVPNLNRYPDDIHERTARMLADGKIVGWVQGRAEFGPRALGNRSILADPRTAEMKDEINLRVKFREEFRPFAPSILHEHGPKWFENYEETPYMERTLIWREEVRHLVPAVVHANDSGRLQSVKREWNEDYYRLIHAFYELTGVPLVLNTSFNIMGKPIIHSIEDAVAVFYTTGLDVLVIGDIMITK